MSASIYARFHGTVREDFATAQEAHEWIYQRAADGGYRLVIDSAPGSDVFEYGVWKYDEARDKYRHRLTSAAIATEGVAVPYPNPIPVPTVTRPIVTDPNAPWNC